MAWRGRGPWSVCVYGGEESEGMEDWRGRPQVKIGHAVGLGSKGSSWWPGTMLLLRRRRRRHAGDPAGVGLAAQLTTLFDLD